MRLITEQGELTLPEDFSFEVEQNSAFFSENGAATVGATIPATGEDLARLGFPTRVARSTKHINTFPAILQHGIYQKKERFSVTFETDCRKSVLFCENSGKNKIGIF